MFAELHALPPVLRVTVSSLCFESSAGNRGVRRAMSKLAFPTNT